MIEDKEAAWDHKEHLGQMEIIILRGWDFRFEKLDRFVAKKTDSAARKKSWANSGASGAGSTLRTSP